MESRFTEKEFLACCGSTQFAKQMAQIEHHLLNNLEQAVEAARNIWFNKVDVNGWLEAFAAHPQIGQSSSSSSSANIKCAQWSKGEQSTALATSTKSSLQELFEWNARYRQKFGFVFLICASGRTTPEILTELEKRYSNRPIVEFEKAAQEQIKITDIRLAKLFATKATSPSMSENPISNATKAEGTIYTERCQYSHPYNTKTPFAYLACLLFFPRHDGVFFFSLYFLYSMPFLSFILPKVVPDFNEFDVRFLNCDWFINAFSELMFTKYTSGRRLQYPNTVPT